MLKGNGAGLSWDWGDLFAAAACIGLAYGLICILGYLSTP